MLGFGSFCLDLGHFAWIWAIMLGFGNLGIGGHNISLWGQNENWGFLARFGPFCLNLGHYAWIWAISLRFGPYCLDMGYLAEFRSEWVLKETKP